MEAAAAAAAAAKAEAESKAKAGTAAKKAETAAPVPGDFFKKGSKLVAVFDVGEGNKANIQAAGFAPAGTELKDMDLEQVTNGETAAKIAENLLEASATGRDIKKPESTGGKPKRKSSKNRRKSKGGRKPKRKSSKNRK